MKKYIILALLLAGAYYYWWKKKKDSDGENKSDSSDDSGGSETKGKTKGGSGGDVKTGIQYNTPIAKANKETISAAQQIMNAATKLLYPKDKLLVVDGRWGNATSTAAKKLYKVDISPLTINQIKELPSQKTA